MNIPTPTGVDFAYIGTLAGSIIYAIYQQFRAGRKDTAEAEKKSLESVVLAKDELNKTITQERDSWRVRFDDKSKDLEAYRQEVHDKSERLNAMVLKSAAEAAELRAKTDLTPILEHMKEDKEATRQIVEQMGSTARILEKILEHIGLKSN